MRGLIRNKQQIWYAEYLGKTEIIDMNGNRTGEFVESYSEPKSAWMNLAPATGWVDWSPFGAFTSYDIAALTCEMDLPIKETSVVWIYKPISEPHDYVVTRVARSLNDIVYALQSVDNAEN